MTNSETFWVNQTSPITNSSEAASVNQTSPMTNSSETVSVPDSNLISYTDSVHISTKQQEASAFFPESETTDIGATSEQLMLHPLAEYARLLLYRGLADKREVQHGE